MRLRIFSHMTKHTKSDTRKKAIVKAMEKTLGIVTTACTKVGIARSTFYEWYSDDEAFRKEIDSIDDMALDFAESELHKQIKGGIPASTIFYLKTKGKSRGYIERTEVTGRDGESLFGNVSDEKAKQIAESIKRSTK